MILNCRAPLLGVFTGMIDPFRKWHGRCWAAARQFCGYAADPGSRPSAQQVADYSMNPEDGDNYKKHLDEVYTSWCFVFDMNAGGSADQAQQER